MMLEWSVVAASVAFIILATGALIAIRSVLLRLAQMQMAADAIRDDLSRLSAEASAVLEPAEQSLRSVQQALRSADGLVQAVRQAGDAIRHTTSAVEQTAAVLSESAKRHVDRMAQRGHADEAMQWAELGLTALELWQARGRTAVVKQRNDFADSSESTD